MQEAEVKKSTHKVEVVPIQLKKHFNADSLSVVDIFDGGYQCCVNTEQWMAEPDIDGFGTRLAAYIPPDGLCDVKRSEFSFLAPQAKADGMARIKAKKLRGIVSFGLLVPAPPGSQIGDDVAELLGVQHYEPELNIEKGGFMSGGEVCSGPPVLTYKYDVDSLRRYKDLFQENEPINVTLKMDGCSSRYVYCEGTQYCGSRTEWKKEYATFDHLTVEFFVNRGMKEEVAKQTLENILNKPKKPNVWWQIYHKYPCIKNFCENNPNFCLYGEIFGNINCIKYGFPDGNRFAAFDVLKNGQWMNPSEAYDLLDKYQVPIVPRLYDVPNFNFEKLCELAQGPDLSPDCKPGTIREGIVVSPIIERYHDRIGRLKMKIVSSDFLEKYR